jgi:gas vesicle protein
MKKRSVRLVLVSAVAVSSLGFAAPAFADDASSAPTLVLIAEPVVASQKGPEAVAEGVVNRSSVDLESQLTAVKAKGAAAIAQRQRTLADLVGKLGAQTKDCGSNGAVSAQLGAAATGLAGVGTALAASTDINAAKTLYRSIFIDFRVYLLVAPKTGKIVRCDVLIARNEALTAEGARVQAAIDAAKLRGANTLAAQSAKDTAMAQLGTIVPANSIVGVAALVPDKGDPAVQLSNTTVLNNSDAALDANAAAQRSVNAQFDVARKLLGQANKTDRENDKEVRKNENEAKQAAKKAENDAKQAAKRAEQDAKKAAREAKKK